MAFSRVARLIGLAMWSSMPAAMQRSRSPGMACAVSASSGTAACRPGNLRIARAADRPSSSGMDTSIRIRSYTSRRAAFSAAAPSRTSSTA
jgi:hypothetical protein